MQQLLSTPKSTRDGRLAPIAYLLAGIFLLPLLIGSGCGEKGNLEKQLPITLAQTINAVITNTESLPGNHSPLFRHEPDPGASLPWKVHVDLSASLQGFANLKDNAFRELLDRISQRIQGVQFVGEGEGNAPGKPLETIDFFKPELYASIGVNYSNVFWQFQMDTNCNHIFVTDGVLCQAGRELQTFAVTQPLRRLLSGGGEFMLLGVLSTYEGEYTSARLVKDSQPGTPAKELTVTINNVERPFLVWIFTQQNQSIDSLLSRLSQAGPAAGNPARARASEAIANWDVLLPRSRPQHRIEICEHELSQDGKDGGDSVFSKLERIDGKVFAPVALGTIFNQHPISLNLDVYLPVPPQGTNDYGTNKQPLVAAALETATTNVVANLSCWNMEENPTTNGPLHKLRLDTVKPRFKNLANSSFEGNLVKSRMIIDVPRPSGAANYQVWLLTLAASPEVQWGETWTKFSTDDDSTLSQAGRIYNLHTLLKDIYDECFVMDRAVFVTYWP